MLRYVVTKLESSSLDNEEVVCNTTGVEEEDSGTETDDETGEEEELAEMDSSPSFPPSNTSHRDPTGRPASTPVYAMGALDITAVEAGALMNNNGVLDQEKENIQDNTNFASSLSSPPVTGGFRQYIRPGGESSHPHLINHHHIRLDVNSDADGNHSSEEELEEINKLESESGESAINSTGEMLSESEFEEPELLLGPVNGHLMTSTPSTPLCETPGSSGEDEEHSSAPHPLQFSTSPPTGTHVHKPRRSLSPPAKMFPLCIDDMETNGGSPPQRLLVNNSSRSATSSPSSRIGFAVATNGLAITTTPSMERHYNVESSTSTISMEESTASTTGSAAVVINGGGSGTTGSGRDRRAISPRKRYRQSRVHHIQRPCLDFEKMQQLKTRAVTSWRHGGELSLFCW